MTRAWHESNHGAKANKVIKKSYDLLMSDEIGLKDFVILQNSWAYLLNVQHNMRKSIAFEKRLSELETLAKLAVKVDESQIAAITGRTTKQD